MRRNVLVIEHDGGVERLGDRVVEWELVRPIAWGSRRVVGWRTAASMPSQLALMQCDGVVGLLPGGAGAGVTSRA